MNIPELYKPKFNSVKRQIPVVNIQEKKLFVDEFKREQPFILCHDLSNYLTETLEAFAAIDKNVRIKTFDSIPYREIREGYFNDYLAYTKQADTTQFYPTNFELIEERSLNITQTPFRHYALSLNEEIFPHIQKFKVPFIENDNYLLQLENNFYQKFKVTSPHWLFIHPKYSVSNAHYDHDAVHTAIFQFKGSKWACLIAPEDHKFLQNKNFPLLPNGFNDFTNDALAQLPTEGLVTWEGELNENQILFIPKRWVHYVVGQSSGISYSQDIVNQTNFNDWMTSVMPS